MKVKELIEKLKMVDQELDVYSFSDNRDGVYYPVNHTAIDFITRVDGDGYTSGGDYIAMIIEGSIY